jgi:DNA-binding NtrC family response regulator
MSRKVLFVDDEPNILEGVRRQLRKLVTLDTASNADEGMQAVLQNGPYAVVISDMRMPYMNGTKFLSQVRAVHPDTVRMILSGQADVDSTIAAINDAQIFRFLTKPCSGDNLVSAVEAALQQFEHNQTVRALLPVQEPVA